MTGPIDSPFAAFSEAVELVGKQRTALTTEDLWQFAQACTNQQEIPGDVIADLIRDYTQLHYPEAQ